MLPKELPGLAVSEPDVQNGRRHAIAKVHDIQEMDTAAETSDSDYVRLLRKGAPSVELLSQLLDRHDRLHKPNVSASDRSPADTIGFGQPPAGA